MAGSYSINKQMGMKKTFRLYHEFIADLRFIYTCNVWLNDIIMNIAFCLQISLSKGNAPMQVDGEPWEQTPAVISLSLYNQATMLANHDS